MQEKKWIIMALFVVIPALMFSVSCQKKVVDATPEPVVEEKEEVVEEKEEVVVYKAPDMVMQEDIYFEFDKSNLTPVAQDNLLRKAEWLRENPDATITIEGHCDERGTNEYNLALGERRSNAVEQLLVLQGVTQSQIQVISFGEERPVALGHDEDAWHLNRRVEILYSGY